MADIHILSRDTVNKIAAGEVIERPVAVVKELVENSIDAHSSEITVEIKEGGEKLIRVTDNGAGISFDNVKLAFTPHATSKIKDITDLDSVMSLGFRGEALASIDSVSYMEMLSKTRDSFIGTRYKSEGGQNQEITEAGCPDGTTFIVRELFYNTPARKKFLKRPQTEAGYIGDVLEKIALSKPEIAFRFINQNQTKLSTPGNGDLKDCIYSIFGKQVYTNLLPVSWEQYDIKVGGYIGKPSINRGNRKFMIYFINGRFIQSNIIGKAILDAFEPYIMLHKFPFTVLNIDISPLKTDVNVHPQKQEVRFDNGQEIYKVIYNAVKDAIEGKELIPKISLDDEEDVKIQDNKDYTFYNAKTNDNLINKGNVSSAGASTFSTNVTSAGASTFSSNAPSASTASFWKIDDMPKESGVHEESGFSKDDKNSGVHEESSFSKDDKNLGVKTYAEFKRMQEERNVAEELLRQEEENIFAGTEQEITGSAVTSEALQGIAKNTGFAGTEQEITESAGLYKGIQEVSEGLHTNEEDIRENSQISMTAGSVSFANYGLKKDEEPKEKAKQLKLSDVDEGFMTEKAIKECKIIGQVFLTYWIMEYDGVMYMIDQHAAHEKVNYERFMKKILNNDVTTQELNPPIIITLSLAEQNVLNEHMEEFERMGFQISEFGGNDYQINGVPDNIPAISKEELFKEMIDSLLSESGNISSKDFMMKVASMSCKAAVKGNNTLDVLEVEKLLKELLTLENPYNCPHGRPTMISFSKTDLDRKFKRIVN
ncbi:MAG: DNA mismatch repair endonuclease MutL [Lachnospiraceae bacterium]|nr:DNA mismatch repair endonuclease MutL [Lachnospiraceae bacterium]